MTAVLDSLLEPEAPIKFTSRKMRGYTSEKGAALKAEGYKLKQIEYTSYSGWSATWPGTMDQPLIIALRLTQAEALQIALDFLSD